MSKKVDLRERRKDDEWIPWNHDKGRGGGGGLGHGAGRGSKDAKKLGAQAQAQANKNSQFQTSTEKYHANVVKRMQDRRFGVQPAAGSASGAALTLTDPKLIMANIAAMQFEKDSIAAKDPAVAELAMYAAVGYDTIQSGDFEKLAKLAAEASERHCAGKSVDVYEDGSVACGLPGGGVEQRLKNEMDRRAKDPKFEPKPMPNLALTMAAANAAKEAAEKAAKGAKKAAAKKPAAKKKAAAKKEKTKHPDVEKQRAGTAGGSVGTTGGGSTGGISAGGGGGAPAGTGSPGGSNSGSGGRSGGARPAEPVDEDEVPAPSPEMAERISAATWPTAHPARQDQQLAELILHTSDGIKKISTDALKRAETLAEVALQRYCDGSSLNIGAGSEISCSAGEGGGILAAIRAELASRDSTVSEVNQMLDAARTRVQNASFEEAAVMARVVRSLVKTRIQIVRPR